MGGGGEGEGLKGFHSSHISDLKMALERLPCLASGITLSALGLVGRVSVFSQHAVAESESSRLISRFYLGMAADAVSRQTRP